MIVIPPLEIDDTILASSSVPEPDASAGEVAWAASTNWATGAVVVRSTTHRRYMRLAPGGVDATLPESAPLLWTDAGPTNRFAMFQHDRNTQTVAASPLVVELDLTKRVDAIGLLGLQAAYARVEMLAGGTAVYDQTFGLSRRFTKSWSDYFFGEFKQVKNILRTDLPPYATATLRVTLTNGSSPVKCAGLIVNRSVYVGRVLAGAKSDARNFSIVERDKWGGLTVDRQRSVPNGAYTVIADKARVDELMELRDEALNGVSALWSGLDDKVQDGYFGLGLIFGFYTQFEIDAAHPNHAVVTLKLEET